MPRVGPLSQKVQTAAVDLPCHRRYPAALSTRSIKALQAGPAVVILGEAAVLHPQASWLRALADFVATATGAGIDELSVGANAIGLAAQGVLPGTGGLSACTMLTQPRQGYLLYGVEPALDRSHIHPAGGMFAGTGRHHGSTIAIRRRRYRCRLRTYRQRRRPQSGASGQVRHSAGSGPARTALEDRSRAGCADMSWHRSNGTCLSGKRQTKRPSAMQTAFLIPIPGSGGRI